MRLAPISIVLAWVTPVHAQVAFPADTAYVPLRCGGEVMTDRVADESGAIEERDIVGDLAAPAGLRAADATHLFLRMRLEGDPAPNGTLRQFTWGMEFDLNGNHTDYELLVLVAGTGGGGNVYVFANTTTTLPNDPNDPADQPAAAMYAASTNARGITAPGSNFGGEPDFFLDFAVPWDALVPLGLDRDTPTSVWAATSSSPNSLNGDFACHDGATGEPQLDDIVSDPTTGDPNEDPGGGGGGGGGGGDGRLEGGGGCAIGGGGSGALLALAVLGLVRRRRYRVVS